MYIFFFFFFQAEDGIRDYKVTGVQTCALPIYGRGRAPREGREDQDLPVRAPHRVPAPRRAPPAVHRSQDRRREAQGLRERMAHKKGVGSSRNGRDSGPKYLGVKRFAGEFVTAGSS